MYILYGLLDPKSELLDPESGLLDPESGLFDPESGLNDHELIIIHKVRHLEKPKA